MKRYDVRVEVFSGEQYDADWPPTDPIGFLAWFQEKIAEIPAEYSMSTNIEIDSVSGYEGSHYGRISIVYTRPETDAEMEARTVSENVARLQHVQRLEEQLKRLKGDSA